MKKVLKKRAVNQKDTLEAYFFCCYCHCTCNCQGVGEDVKYNRSDAYINTAYDTPEDQFLWY